MTVVFYRPEMSVRTASFSPSSDKPRKAVNDWLTHPDLEGKRPTIMSFEPLEKEELTTVHDPAYVRGVFDGTLANGFGNRNKAVAEACRYTVGSFYWATRYAWDNKRNACSPTSGFHHAGYNFGGGFCTFNGLALAALWLTCGERFGTRVLVLDLDQHAGNGTSNIMRCVKEGDCDGKFETVKHFSAGEHPLRDWADVHGFVLSAFEADDHDIVLYQAGADMHIDDPLGGLLDTEEMYRRDRLVFGLARNRKVPVVWNLAGGYQQDEGGSIEPVLLIHRNTYRASREFDVVHQGQDQEHNAPPVADTGLR